MERELPTEEPVLEETTTEEEVEVTEEVVEDKPEIAKEPESVEDSVRKAIEAEKAAQREAQADGDKTKGQDDSGEGINTKPEGEVKPELEKKKGKREVIPDLGEFPLDPPARLSQAEKQVFAKLPNHLKPAVARMFKEHEAHFSRTQGEYSKALNEARHIIEAVRPYYTSNPGFAQNGITESALVTKLIGTHQALLEPKTSKSKLAEVAASLGHRIAFIDEDGDVEADSPHQDIDNHPKFRALQEKIDRLESETKTRTFHEKAAPIVAEIDRLQQEKDTSGNFAYPELRSMEFIQSVRPLVSALVGNNPSPESYGKALRRAVLLHRQENGYPNGNYQTKPPQNNNIINQRAISAARTVRGGVTPAVSASLANEMARPDESMEDSVRMAINQLKRGVNN